MEDTTTPAHLSLSRKEWIDPEPIQGAATVRTLSNDLDISETLAEILALRGIADVDAAHRFLHPDEAQLHPPQLMLGMHEAVQRIMRAVDDYEKILVIGDYDVDGTAGAVILFSYLKRLGARVGYYIPQRLSDGYGFTPSILRRIVEWKTGLVITADFGSTEVEAPGLLKPHGIDLIITDHHQLGPTAPDAAALVNPHQPNCPYPFKDLSAAGVSFKVVCALDDHLEKIDFWNRRGICHTAPSYFLDMVALATVADMSPLRGENRVLVKLGLDQLNGKPRPGMSGLVKECRLRGPITPRAITLKLAPKINALGRVGDPRMGVQLLLSHSFTEGRRLARQLMDVNRARQVIEREVYAMAREQMDSLPDLPAIILVGDNWHQGVIGSIATRLAYQEGRPTIVLTHPSGDELSGSARGMDRYDVLSMLEDCQMLLERFGGHRNAAGLSLFAHNLPEFSTRFQSAVEKDGMGLDPDQERRRLRIEAWIGQEDLTPQLVDEMNRLSPFGQGNPEPVVGVRGFRPGNPAVINNRHLKFHLPCGTGQKLEAFAWDHSDWELEGSGTYDMAFTPQTAPNHNGGHAQLSVLDLKNTG